MALCQSENLIYSDIFSNCTCGTSNYSSVPFSVAGYTCIAPFTIANSASISPVSNEITGFAYTVVCNTGHTVVPSGGDTGNLVCDDTGAWLNQPGCSGELWILYSYDHDDAKSASGGRSETENISHFCKACIVVLLQ